jgi:hypothetical protein
MRYNDFTRTPELISTAYEASSAYLQALNKPRRAPAAPAPPTAASDNVLA